MATVDISDVRPKGNRLVESKLDRQAELWSPPLAPSGTMALGHVVPPEDTIRPFADKDAFQPPEPTNLSETKTHIGFRQKMIAGSAIIAVLGGAGLVYFLLASPAAKAPADSSQIAVQTSAESPVEPSSPTSVELPSEKPGTPAPAMPGSSREASGAVPSADVLASLQAEASQVAPSAVPPPTASAAQPRDLLFLQRPGVNIRSAPSANAPVLGTAPKGTPFTPTRRERDWIQVENTRWKGWINSQFLAPNKPL
jgi:hypothetical protein